MEGVAGEELFLDAFVHTYYYLLLEEVGEKRFL